MLVRFVCDVSCDTVCGVCHCVWLFCLKCLCVLFVVYCDVVRFVICLCVLLCLCLCVFGRFMCLCVLFEAYRVMLYGLFNCGCRVFLFCFVCVVHVDVLVCCVRFIA